MTDKQVATRTQSAISVARQEASQPKRIEIQ